MRRFDRKGNVLDLGYNPCVLTHRLLNKGTRVVSLDPSPDMISMAHKIPGEYGVPAAELQQFDIDGCVKRYGGIFGQLVWLELIEHIKEDDEDLN